MEDLQKRFDCLLCVTFDLNGSEEIPDLDLTALQKKKVKMEIPEASRKTNSSSELTRSAFRRKTAVQVPKRTSFRLVLPQNRNDGFLLRAPHL